jgi:hypothetical protein
MCCFSIPAASGGLFARLFGKRPSVSVSGTRIFARVEAGVQQLVYSMSVTTPGDVAMVLPLPVAPGTDEQALSFVDLSGYDSFFDHLSLLFELPVTAQAKGGFQVLRHAPKLEVHQVGSFEASFVPTLADFDRLDSRFRLPASVWDQRPEYSRFGFAVFKLKRGKRAKIHPMAMRFPSATPDTIFFPTLHVHDGALHLHAEFEHDLYFQLPKDFTPDLLPPGGAESAKHHGRSYEPAKSRVDVTRSKELVDGEAPVWHWPLHAELPNADTRVKIAPPVAEAAA